MSDAIELEVLDAKELEQTSFAMVGKRDARLVQGDIVKKVLSALLTRASVIGDVSDPEVMKEAVLVLGSAKLAWKAIEARRVALKAPILAEGRTIDTDIGKPLDQIDEKVIKVLQRKIDAETTRQLRLKREAEAKLERELKAAKATANNAKAEIRQSNTDEDYHEAVKNLTTAQAAIQTITTTPVPLPPPVAGMSTGSKWVGTVVNAKEAYEIRPEFFELVVKQSVLNEAIRGGFRGCAGVKVEEVGKARVNL